MSTIYTKGKTIKVKKKKMLEQISELTGPALRKKVGLKETQQEDWKDVGFPIIDKNRKPKPFNLVKGQYVDKEINVKGGKGFKLRKKK